MNVSKITGTTWARQRALSIDMAHIFVRQCIHDEDDAERVTLYCTNSFWNGTRGSWRRKRDAKTRGDCICTSFGRACTFLWIHF